MTIDSMTMRVRRTGILIHRPLVIGIAGVMLAVVSACGNDPGLAPGYAIVYGVARYAHISSLRQPDDDATAIASLLVDQGYTLIGDGPRLNEAATKDNLLADFSAAAALAEPGSSFFFYFAGHGYGAGMEAYYSDPPFSQEWADYLASLEGTGATAGREGVVSFLFLHEADPFSDVPLTIRESIRTDELASLLAGIRSRQKIVVMDACHSGGFIGSDGSYDTVPSSYSGSSEGISLTDAVNAASLYLSHGALDPGAAGQAAAVISASGAHEFSYEGDWAGLSNGVFTHYFLQAPLKADRNHDGYVTVSEAYAYAAAAIASEINHRLSGDARFLPRVSGGAVDFVLFRAIAQ